MLAKASKATHYAAMETTPSEETLACSSWENMDLIVLSEEATPEQLAAARLKLDEVYRDAKRSWHFQEDMHDEAFDFFQGVFEMYAHHPELGFMPWPYGREPGAGSGMDYFLTVRGMLQESGSIIKYEYAESIRRRNRATIVLGDKEYVLKRLERLATKSRYTQRLVTDALSGKSKRVAKALPQLPDYCLHDYHRNVYRQAREEIDREKI